VIDAVLRVPSPNIQLPEKAMRAAMLVDSPQRRLRRGTRRPDIHVVRRGDTLYALAQRLGTDVQTLAQANGIKAGARLHAGQRLHFGGSSALVSDASAGSARSIATTGAQSASEGGRRMTYIVRRGDTLYGIARLLQVTVNELMGWNGMSGEHSLRPGQTLVAFVKTRNSG
jgi:LysM repeat protein